MCKLWESSPEKKTWLSLRSAWTVLKPLQFSLRFKGRKGSKKSVLCYSIWESSVPMRLRRVYSMNASKWWLQLQNYKRFPTNIATFPSRMKQDTHIRSNFPCLCKCLHHAGNPLRIEIMRLETALFSCHQSRLGINLTYTSEKILMWNSWCASYGHSG